MEKAEIEKLKERLAEIERIQNDVASGDNDEFNGILAELRKYKENTDPEVIQKVNELLKKHKGALIKFYEKLKRENKELSGISP